MPMKRKMTAAQRRAVKRSLAKLGMRRVPRPIKRKIPLALQTHNFCERSTIEDNLLCDGSAGLFRHFQLNEMQQSGEYIQLFEEYRINKVVATFRYKANSTVAVGNSLYQVNEINPVLYFKVDHNSDSTTVSLADMKESMKTREHQFTNDKPEFSVVLKPAVLVEASTVEGAIGTHYYPQWKKWLPVEEGAIGHYGLQAYCVAGSGGGTSQPGSLKVTYKIYFSCKNNN